jgi:hypothetical protein
MPRPKGSKNKPKENISQVSGTMYLFSDGSYYWADRDIDATTIEEFKRNPYITARFTQLSNLIFQDDFILEIDNENGLPDEEIATKIRKMIEAPDVDLNYQARQCFASHFWHGPYIFNPVYGKDEDDPGWVSLIALRDLPAKSFDCSPEGFGLTPVLKSELYPGISLMSDGEIHYYQKEEVQGEIKELKSVYHAKPPNDFTNDISGMPLFYPIIPVLNRLNFAWKCQMQRVNRVGAMSIFISITDPIVVTDEKGNPIPGKRNDYEYANTILQNWGTNNSFAIPSNMEIVELKGHESDSAMETIHELAKLIVNQWSPTEQISTDGNSKLGGSQEAATTLLINFITGFHRHIAKVFKSIVMDILEYNNFKGYTANLYFPKPEFRNSEIDLARATEGRTAGTISANEHRMLLGHEPESDEDLKTYSDYWVNFNKANRPPVSQPFGGNGEDGEGEEKGPNANTKGKPEDASTEPLKGKESQTKGKTTTAKAPAAKKQPKGQKAAVTA